MIGPSTCWPGSVAPGSRPPEAWADALALKRSGREWVGPCPLCGGDDRFHVRDRGDGTALVGCRGCMDGGQDPDGSRFLKLVRTVFPDSRPPGRETRPQDGPGRTFKSRPIPQDPRNLPQEAVSRESPALTPSEIRKRPPGGAQAAEHPFPGRLWAASLPATETPAHGYLVRRGVWPPKGIGPNLPATVRWLPRARVPLDPAAKWYGLPQGAAGVMLFRFAHLGAGEVETAAVSLEALTKDGERLDWTGGERWRRTFGEKKGAAFVAADPLDPADLVLTEGEVSALAATWTHPGAFVLATGGTAGLRGVAPLLLAAWPGLAVVIEADGDRPGRDAGLVLADLLRRNGRTVRVVFRQHGDAADVLAADLAERAAILEADGLARSEAEARAWRLVLERTAKDG